ncbi:MAG: YwiC-like family protein [Brooklawnia sp.]|uniref:YwiC-like family protein n=1 Tax=Brooklawnia sp. TaxID=2699740 RepID=UPI003C73B21D
MTTPQATRTPTRHSNQGWIPRQHGAWAMLIVPFVVGVVLRSRVATLDVWLVPLAVTVLAAYFCFNALTYWLRSAPARRATYARPVLVHGAIALVFGVAAMVMGGWPIIAWLPIGLPFAVLAIWLAGRRKDRAVASGFATMVLAVGMGLVVRFVTPAAMLDGWPAGGADVAIIVALFTYFFGTVLHVKALIRERGQRPARIRSVGYHAVATLVAVGTALAGWTSPLWVIFFALTTARAWYMSLPVNVGRFAPLQIGMVEIGLSVGALVISLL